MRYGIICLAVTGAVGLYLRWLYHHDQKKDTYRVDLTGNGTMIPSRLSPSQVGKLLRNGYHVTYFDGTEFDPFLANLLIEQAA